MERKACLNMWEMWRNYSFLQKLKPTNQIRTTKYLPPTKYNKQFCYNPLIIIILSYYLRILWTHHTK